MTMPTNEEIQEALVAYLKSKTSITSLLVDLDGIVLGATEIREDQWQGSEFFYPNIRVRMINNNPLGESDQCNASSFQVSFMVYSEPASSHQSENISGAIGTLLHARTFTQGNLNIFLRVINLIPAVRTDRNAWRAECLMQGVATRTFYNWWQPAWLSSSDCVGAYLSKGAGSYANSKNNLVNPSLYNLIDTGHAPDWDNINGWKFDGISEYLDTEIDNSTSQWTMIIKYSNLVLHAAFASICGLSAAGASCLAISFLGDGSRDVYEEGLGSYQVIRPYTTNGIKGLSHFQGYLNGISDNGTPPNTVDWGSPFSALHILLGCQDYSGDSPSNFADVYIQAFVIYKKSFTAQQVAYLINSMNLL